MLHLRAPAGIGLPVSTVVGGDVAVRVGVQEIVEFLTDHGADVNAKDREGIYQYFGWIGVTFNVLFR